VKGSLGFFERLGHDLDAAVLARSRRFALGIGDGALPKPS